MKKTKTTKQILNMIENPEEKRIFILYLAKLELNSLTQTKKVELADHIVGAMTGNANFATPSPTLASVTAAAADLLAKQAALDGSKVKLIARDNAEKVLDTKLRGIQTYVENVAAGNKEIIASAGLALVNPRTVTPKLGPVTELTYKLGYFPGTIDIKWKGIKRSKLYVVEARPYNAAGDWTIVGETTKSKITIDELQSGSTYEFRIICVSTAGPGLATDPFLIKVY